MRYVYVGYVWYIATVILLSVAWRLADGPEPERAGAEVSRPSARSVDVPLPPSARSVEGQPPFFASARSADGAEPLPALFAEERWDTMDSITGGEGLPPRARGVVPATPPNTALPSLAKW